MAAAVLADQRIPGLALIVLQGDEVVHARGCGLEDAGALEAVSPETVFQLGSISKQFLAALVLRYAEQGRLSLEDGVTRHLAEFSRLPCDLLFSRNVREWRAIATSPSAFPQIDAGRVRDLVKPVLLLSGGQNAGGYNDLIDGYLEQLLPNAQWVVIADASHEMFLDYPQESARALDFFVGKSDGNALPGR